MLRFTVWVGGAEVTDYLVTKTEALAVARRYEEDGYDDVFIEEVYVMEGN